MKEHNNTKDNVKHSFLKLEISKESNKKKDACQNKTMNIKTLLEKADSKVKLNHYKGPFCLSCATMKNPPTLLEDIRNSFEKFRIKYRKKEEFFLICEKENVNFEMEIMRLEEASGLNYLRLKNLNSESDKYRDLVMKILGCMRI